VAAGYDAIAERYAAWQAEIADDPRPRYVGELLRLLPERPDILEVGCGAGIEPTPTLARRGRLVGIDISARQVERARLAVPEAEFLHGDVLEAEFEPESFDAVVSLFCLTHVPTADLPVLLERVATWLRPSGPFLATFGAGGPHDSFVEDFLGAPMFFSGFDVDTNERLVTDAGLEVLTSRVEHMWEPESEPGRGPQEAAFHWVMARKPA
jgi:SAM-dependent methyltransferase